MIAVSCQVSDLFQINTKTALHKRSPYPATGRRSCVLFKITQKYYIKIMNIYYNIFQFNIKRGLFCIFLHLQVQENVTGIIIIYEARKLEM